MSLIEQSIHQVTDLISLPEIYLKFRQLMDDPSSEIDDFAGIIRFDPNLTSKLLRVVNSAFFGLVGKVDSIPRAINMLGIGQLHDMVLGISAISSLKLPNDIMPLKTFWRCSLLTGVISRLLAEQLNVKRSERLFVIGLLHEIGHLILYTNYAEDAKKVHHAASESDQKIHEVEQELLGIHYGKIGAILMKQWNLSDDFQALTQYQPTPQKATELCLETAILHLAHGYAHTQITDSKKTLDQLIDPIAWEMTKLNPEQVNDVLEEAQTQSADIEKVIFG